ncbi:MAG TPA: caspase family protein [Thermoanaerobaculia bacterium]|nr:caspase family protein [Thermoanaerobaculia bacterium]
MKGKQILVLLLLEFLAPFQTSTAAQTNRGLTYEPEAARVAKPSLYLLSVGVSHYRNPDFNLDLPAKDASDVAALWKAQEGRLYGAVETRLLTDQQATRDAILAGLEWLETRATQRDVAILFFAGHGLNDPRTGEYVFLPHNADLAARRTTLLPDREVRSALSSLPGKVLVFLDTCHAGNLLGDARTRGPADLGRLLDELAEAESGVVVFAAAGKEQKAQETPGWTNGAFTRALLEALSGKADLDGDRSLRVAEIESYLGTRVRDLTGGLQVPVTRKPGSVPDFPVAVLPGVSNEILASYDAPPPRETKPAPLPEEPALPAFEPQRIESKGFLFELVSCRASGNRVSCDLFITNQGEDRQLVISNGSRVFDEGGNEVRLESARVADSSGSGVRKFMVSGIRTEASVTFAGFPAQSRKISLLLLEAAGKISFRDIPVR